MPSSTAKAAALNCGGSGPICNSLLQLCAWLRVCCQELAVGDFECLNFALAKVRA